MLILWGEAEVVCAGVWGELAVGAVATLDAAGVDGTLLNCGCTLVWCGSSTLPGLWNPCGVAGVRGPVGLRLWWRLGKESAMVCDLRQQ